MVSDPEGLIPLPVEQGWGGPFGAVIVKDGEIVGRGQNRVLLTGCPVFHAEVTAIMDACQRLNPKALLGSGASAAKRRNRRAEGGEFLGVP
jgi:tRNA(Arg) A34 adenosine deaminase TadA